MEKRRVVITGMGAVTPLGHTVQETWDAVRAGACGIAPITPVSYTHLTLPTICSV